MSGERPPSPLDRFIPRPDVRERFEIGVRAPASTVLDVAGTFDMQSLPAVRGIIRLREIVMGATPPLRVARGLLEETQALGWGRLDEVPGRYVVMGATCQPWLADVRFCTVPAEDFGRFAEADHVKIAWTLEAYEREDAPTLFVQETRAVATDDAARVKFRRYWRWARFGIVAIRMLMMPAVRREVEKSGEL